MTEAQSEEKKTWPVSHVRFCTAVLDPRQSSQMVTELRVEPKSLSIAFDLTTRSVILTPLRPVPPAKEGGETKYAIDDRKSPVVVPFENVACLR